MGRKKGLMRKRKMTEDKNSGDIMRKRKMTEDKHSGDIHLVPELWDEFLERLQLKTLLLLRHMTDGEDTNLNSGGTCNGIQYTNVSMKSRGVTLMKNIDRLRAKGETIHVEFSSNGEPLGKNGSKFRSYLGVLARSKVPITIEDWKHVSDDIKNCIWDDIKTVFVGIEHRKEEEMKVVATMWRNFKAKLTNKYITIKTAKEGENPLHLYPFITEEIWKEFVASRQTKEFLAKSEEQRRRQAHNVYPHTMSRGGYVKLEKKLKKEKLEELKSSTSKLEQLKSSISKDDISLSSIEIPRHIKWTRGRINKEGKYTTNEIEIVAKKIDELNEKSSKGSFISCGRNDILTVALGTEEHPGRVRGVGGNVGFTKVFGKTKREPRFTMKEFEDMIEYKVKSILMTMTQSGIQLPQHFMLNNDQQNSVEVEVDSMKGQSVRNSCPIDPFPLSDIPEEGVKCHLMVDKNGKREKVAIGRVFGASDGQLHGSSLSNGQVKVSIEIPLVEDVDVPVPTSEVQNVVQAIGGFIAWPKNLVELDEKAHDYAFKGHDMERKKFGSDWTKESINQPMHEEMPHVIPSMLPRGCLGLYGLARRISQSSPVIFPIEKNVMHIAFDLYVSKVDIFQLLGMTMLNTSCMEFYMKYLHHLCDDKGISDLYGFICPSITRCSADLMEKIEYMEKCFVDGKKQCFLVPYIDDMKKHWMLAAIYPFEDIVYWLDPLGDSPCPNFKTMVEAALRAYHVKGGLKKQGAKMSWVKVKCQRQKGGTECGYFVMTYMRDIINGIHDDDPQKCFGEEIPYTQDEIDVTRCQWATFFQECESIAPHDP